jgi:hypothetical protein
MGTKSTTGNSLQWSDATPSEPRRGTFMHRDRPLHLIVDPGIKPEDWDAVWRQDLGPFSPMS